MKSKLIILIGVLSIYCNTPIFAGVFAVSFKKEFVGEQDTLVIVSREQWGALPPKNEMKKLIPNKITIHHDGVNVASSVDPLKKMKALQAFSQRKERLSNGKMKKAWSDIPYHFLVFPNGEIYEGRSIDYIGDTNTNYNPQGHILIDVVGNFEVQKPTNKQLNSLSQLLEYLMGKYNIYKDSIGLHKDYAKTSCPGKNLSVEILKIKKLNNQI